MPRWSAKLPTASVMNAWSLDDLPDPAGFWRTVAATIAQHIGAADTRARDAVAAAIENYVRDAEDEGMAVPVAAARERIAELRRAAAVFARAIDAPRSPASGQAESLIEDMADHDRTLSFRVLGESAYAFVAACDRALAQLDAIGRKRHFAPGEAWARFIASLADAFEASTGDAATASKGPGADRPSRFVRFAHAIQSQLPPQFWRHPAAGRRSCAPATASTTFSEAAAKALAARRAQTRRLTKK